MAWWEIVFMLVVLKIPIVYLCAVVWWAIRAEPVPDDGGLDAFGDGPHDRGPRPWWQPPRRRRTSRPHGVPARPAASRARPAFARGKVER